MENKSNSKELILSNDSVEFVFNCQSGALRQIHHKQLNHTLEIPASAVSPVRIFLGNDSNPDIVEALVSQDTQLLTSCRTYNYEGGVGAELLWDDMRDTQDRCTGIALRIFCMLDDNTEFLRLTTHVANQGDYLITGIFLGLDGVVVDDSAKETLTVPSLMGERWSDPRGRSIRKDYTIPPTPPGGLTCCWSDIGTPVMGFGAGYLNRKSIDMLGVIRCNPKGATLGWQLFRLEDGWKFMDAHKKYPKVYPLQKDEDFQSDDWFLGFHQKDWHETARFYRKEYERVFADDFLPWDKVAPVARSTDIVLNISCAWGVMDEKTKQHDLTRGELRVPFLEVPTKLQQRIKSLGVHPENCVMVMIGQATHWGIYKLPDYFPVNKEAGGPEAFKEMIRRLRQDIGIAGTHFYVHLAFNHPQADNYVASADTGWTANLYSNFDHLGRIANMDHDDWWQLWKKHIIPQFVEAGANGLEVDEGFGHHFIWEEPGLSSESILTAQSRGAMRILREFRRAAGPTAYLQCEGFSDVQARHVDFWEASSAGAIEIVRYTHPDKMVTCFPVEAEHVVRAFVYGMPVLSTWGAEVWPEHRRFVALRKELRDSKAPGYPHRFRDNDGISSSPDGLVAKAYEDSEGITITYYATRKVSGALVTDGKALDHPEIGLRRETLNLKSLEFGYFIYKNEGKMGTASNSEGTSA